MLNVVRCLMLVCLSIAVVGCAPQAGQSKVAVVKFEDALQDSGYLTQIQDTLKEQQSQLNRLLSNHNATLNKNYEEKKKEFGEKPTEEQSNQLKQMQVQMSQQLNFYRNRAGQRLGGMQQELQNAFRTKVLLPKVEKIAKEKGFDVVLLKEPRMLAYNSKVDITDDIVEAIKEGEQVELTLEQPIPDQALQNPGPGANGTPGNNNVLNPSAPVKKPADDKKEDKTEKKKETKADAKKTDEKKVESKKEATKEEAKKTETKEEPKKTEEKKADKKEAPKKENEKKEEKKSN